MQEKTGYPSHMTLESRQWLEDGALEAESVRCLRRCWQQTWRWRYWPGLAVRNITGSKDDSDLVPAQMPGNKLTPWKMWELNRSWCPVPNVTTFYASYSIMEGFWDYANQDQSTHDISLNRMRLCSLPPPSKEESNTIQIQQSLKEDSSPAREPGSSKAHLYSLPRQPLLKRSYSITQFCIFNSANEGILHKQQPRSVYRSSFLLGTQWGTMSNVFYYSLSNHKTLH